MKINLRQIQLFSVLYLILWMLAPPLAYDNVYRILAVIMAILWIIVQIVNKHTIIKKNKYLQYYLIYTVIYLVVLLLFRCLYDNMRLFQAIYNDITTYILLFNGYIAGIYYVEKRYKDLKYIFYFSIAIGVIFSITTIFRSNEFYYFTRNAGGDVTDENIALAMSAAKHGVGSFGFFCFTSVFSPILLLYTLERKKNKLLLMICFFIMEFGVLSAGYTLALLISFVGIFLVLFFRIKNIYNKILLILLGIVLFLFSNDIMNVIYLVLKQISAGSMYENKVNDIFGFLVEGESAGSFAARQERYLYSLSSIFKYPILGSYVIANIRAVGYHSSILDTFAAYGWIIGSIYTYITISYPYKISNLKNIKLNLIFFILLFFTALFNTYTMNMGIFYYLIPYVIYTINKKTNF